ncbi:MAG: SMP-30/gluconolactonase/LRE family protein [Paenibacillaceae bacterium]|nr:SMP-30/gluconolactonase/LRE family protein [Paenibacillaceae bacterium]
MEQLPVWNGKQAILPASRASVFFDGTFTEPQLNHPEGIAFDSDGQIWCGGERGEIFRIDRDGGSIEQVASTGGFTLGLTFDSQGNLYSCDLKLGAVFRLNTKTGELSRFADGDGQGNNIRIPNVPVVDEKSGWLYVSDSFHPQQPGPGIWRFDLETGEGRLWYDGSLHFANGLAMSGDGDALFVAETFGRRIAKIPIQTNGSPGEKQIVTQVDALPDGLTLDPLGRIYISCYEPSLIYRWSRQVGLELLFYDRDAHTLCHPTNCAFRDNDLFTSNLGRWHITRIADVLASNPRDGRGM